MIFFSVGVDGISLSPSDYCLFILLFADDLALLSTSISSLQNQLNVPYSANCRLGLFANLYKSKIVIFSNRFPANLVVMRFLLLLP